MQIFNALMARAIPFIPRAIIQKISRRYIAGATPDEALARVQQLNAQGFSVTLDVLGETVSTLQQAEKTASDYIDLLEASPLRLGCSSTRVNALVSQRALLMPQSSERILCA